MTNLNPPIRVLVTGGTGAIGPVLVRRLVEKNYQVRVLVRQPPRQGLLPPAVELAAGDITDPASLEPAMAGVDRVFHLAARLHLTDPTEQLLADYEQVNLTGTGRVVEAALKAGVGRLVYFSSIAVYGPSDGRTVFTEASLPNPQSLYAQTKYRAESMVLAARRSGPAPSLGVVLRVAAVYGAGIKGNYARLVTALQKHRFLPVGSGRNRRTLIHEQDVVEAALLAAESPQAAGQIYNVTDGQTPTFNQIITAICQAMGHNPPRWHLPEEPLRLLVNLVEQSCHRLGRTAPIGHHTLDTLLEDVAVSGDKLQEELGFYPTFDLNTGWAVTLNQLETAGQMRLAQA